MQCRSGDTLCTVLEWDFSVFSFCVCEWLIKRHTTEIGFLQNKLRLNHINNQNIIYRQSYYDSFKDGNYCTGSVILARKMAAVATERSKVPTGLRLLSQHREWTVGTVERALCVLACRIIHVIVIISQLHFCSTHVHSLYSLVLNLCSKNLLAID